MRTKKINLILESNFDQKNNDEFEEKSSSEEDDYNPVEAFTHHKPADNCCSKFRYTYLGNCCCKWLIPDYSEFPFSFSKSFSTGQNQFWTCNNCEYGFRCS